jgi:putative transposase
LQWKSSAIRLRNGKMVLSNGAQTPPLALPWGSARPTLVEIIWNGEEYVLRAIYRTEPRMAPTGSGIIGVDLGEVHIAAASDGKKSVILNGRYLRSKRRYQNKLKGQLAAIIAKKKRGSRRYLKIARSKRRQLRKLQNQIRDVLH